MNVKWRRFFHVLVWFPYKLDRDSCEVEINNNNSENERKKKNNKIVCALLDHITSGGQIHTFFHSYQISKWAKHSLSIFFFSLPQLKKDFHCNWCDNDSFIFTHAYFSFSPFAIDILYDAVITAATKSKNLYLLWNWKFLYKVH